MFCLTHLVRECTGQAESGENWTKTMNALLYDIIRADQRGSPLSDEEIAELEKRFDDIVQESLHYHNQLDPLPPRSRSDQACERVINWPFASIIIVIQLCGVSITRLSPQPIIYLIEHIHPLKLKHKISGIMYQGYRF